MPDASETSANVPSPLIPVQDVGAAGEAERPARHRDLVVAAIRALPRTRRRRRIEVDVVGDEQIEAAVAVVVEEAAAGAPALRRSRHAGLLGHVGERAVAVVVVEDVAAPVADEQIVEAVVVVVADAAALSPARMRQPGLARHVGEGAVAVVVEQVTGRLRRLHRRIEAGAVHQEDVQPAVVVVVEQRDTAAHLLEQELLVDGAAGTFTACDRPAGSGDVGEQRRRCKRPHPAARAADTRPAQPSVRRKLRRDGATMR